MEKGKQGQLVFPPLAPRDDTDAKASKSCRNKEVFGEYLIKHYVKTLKAWFDMWQPWQRRVLICEVMSHCTKQLLQQLSTSMEPVLHVDFSTSLLPPLQELHLQGTAKFQVLRYITKRVAKPEILTDVSSQDYLGSLPSTFGTGPSRSLPKYPETNAVGIKQSLKPHTPRQKKIRRAKTFGKIDPVTPSLPLVHPKHVSSKSISNDASTTRNITTSDFHRRFDSVPQFKVLSGQVRNAKYMGSGEVEKLLRRNASGNTVTFLPLRSEERKAEKFKEELQQVGNWMKTWDKSQKLYLINHIIKFCNKELLGYFVQCLHQKLTEFVTIDALPDSALLNVFSYLDAKDLCSVTEVCKRWNRLGNMSCLWKRVTHQLGRSLGMRDMTLLIETVAKFAAKSKRRDLEEDDDESLRIEIENDLPEIEWKKTYRKLLKLVKRMTEILKKRISTTSEVELPEENPLIKKMELAVGKIGLANFTLLEMLQILRAKCSNPLLITTYDLVQTAPHRPGVLRRRRRMELIMRQELEAAQAAVTATEEVKTMGTQEDSNKLRVEEAEASHDGMLFEFITSGTGSTSMSSTELLKKPHRDGGTSSKNQRLLGTLLQSVMDMRPNVPHLPDLDGIQCLILSDGLISGVSPRPARIMSLVKTKRLGELDYIVLCLQFDTCKLVMGTSNRNLIIIDIRTGRRVGLLEGHKGSVQCVQFDTFKVVSGSWDHSCIVWDVIHHKFLKQLFGHTDTVSCLQFDEDILVTGSFDGSLRVWNTSNWETSTILGSAHIGGVTCMKFNSSVIISGGIDKTVKIWSRESYHCLCTFPHHLSPLTAIGLSRLLLVTCSLNGLVVFWSLDSFQSIMRRKLHQSSHITHIVSTQNKLYGATSGGTVLEIDICTGTCMRTLVGHSGSLIAICLCEHKLVTAGLDGTVLVWYFKKALDQLEDTRALLPQRTPFTGISVLDEFQEKVFEEVPICTAKTDKLEMKNI